MAEMFCIYLPFEVAIPQYNQNEQSCSIALTKKNPRGSIHEGLTVYRKAQDSAVKMKLYRLAAPLNTD